ncbi:hypothetical protein HDV05_003747 [Chytridiales sp. JEL 0842]|nr:hypothetical protein HDV05_003747 [Chytridiales sp. JEL 0842]
MRGSTLLASVLVKQSSHAFSTKASPTPSRAPLPPTVPPPMTRSQSSRRGSGTFEWPPTTPLKRIAFPTMSSALDPSITSTSSAPIPDSSDSSTAPEPTTAPSFTNHSSSSSNSSSSSFLSLFPYMTTAAFVALSLAILSKNVKNKQELETANTSAIAEVPSDKRGLQANSSTVADGHETMTELPALESNNKLKKLLKMSAKYNNQVPAYTPKRKMDPNFTRAHVNSAMAGTLATLKIALEILPQTPGSTSELIAQQFQYESDEQLSALLNEAYPPLLQAIVKATECESVDSASLKGIDEYENYPIENQSIKSLLGSFQDNLYNFSRAVRIIISQWLPMSAQIRNLLPDHLLNEIDFLSQYIQHSINTREVLDLPLLFPNEFEVDSMGAIVKINRPFSVFILRNLARTVAGVAVALLAYIRHQKMTRQIESAIESCSPPTTSYLKTLVRGVPSTASHQSTSSYSTFSTLLPEVRQVAEPETSHYPVPINYHTGGFLVAAAEKKRELRRATVEAVMTGEAMDLKPQQPSCNRRRTLGANDFDDHPDIDMFGALSLSVTEKKLVASQAPTISTDCSVTSSSPQLPTANTPCTSSASTISSSAPSPLTCSTHASDESLSDSGFTEISFDSNITLEDLRCLSVITSTPNKHAIDSSSYDSYSPSSPTDPSWESFKLQQAGIPEDILRLEFEAIRAGLGSDSLSGESGYRRTLFADELDAW